MKNFQLSTLCAVIGILALLPFIYFWSQSEFKCILHNVIKFCDEETLEGKFTISLFQSIKHTSEIICISKATKKRICI